jgi:NAD(P) transhydrogenase subunit beta
MGMLYGIGGMSALIAAYWADTTYTYADGPWLVAASMAPGAILGLVSAYAVGMTGLPEMVGAYNGFGGLAAALTGIGTYLDPQATLVIRNGNVITEQSDSMLWVQGVALVLSIVIGMMTFTGSMVAVCKLHGWLASRPRVLPMRGLSNLIMLAVMIVFGALAFSGNQYWNDRGAGMGYILIVTVVAALYGFTSVMVSGTYFLVRCECFRSISEGRTQSDHVAHVFLLSVCSVGDWRWRHAGQYQFPKLTFWIQYVGCGIYAVQ